MDFRNLNRYRIGGTTSNIKLGVPPPRTPAGRVYRYSPNPDAYPRHFVLGNHDPDFVVTEEARARMKLEPHSNQSVCPYSGVVAANEEFLHPDDKDAALEIVKDAALRDAEAALHKAFSGFSNRSSGKGFPTIKTTYTPSSPRPKPRFARRDLLRELVCDHCSRDYGVFAISLFCHDCGAPNLHLHFAREAELIAQQVELATVQSEAAAELSYRLLGNAHEDVLTAFEATQKAVYLYGKVNAGTKPDEIKPVGNDFQNVERAQRRWAELGIDPYACLEADALDALKLNIQKRHIIGHNLGVMDTKFASQSADARVGETVRLVASDVIAFAESCQRIVNGLDNWLTGSKEAAHMVAPTTPTPQPSSSTASKAEPDLGLGLSPLAQRVGLWIAKHSENGLTDFVDDDALAAAFADDATEIAEALADLEAEGLVSTIYRGRDVPTVRPTIDLYASLDRQAVGSDPLTDAAELTKVILGGADQIASAELHASTGWSLRRFNPALALVLAQVDSRRVSAEICSDYPSRHFFLMPIDRAELKRFLKRNAGDV
jgi:hypothetical protein